MRKRELPTKEQLDTNLYLRKRSIAQADEEHLPYVVRGSQGASKASSVSLPQKHGRIGIKVARDESGTVQKRLWANLFGTSSSQDASYKKEANTLTTSDSLLAASDPTAANTIGLEIEGNNIGYVATINIGEKNTPFKMLIDSGSADTWVPSSDCKNCGSSQQKLSKEESSSLKESKQTWSIKYGTGEADGVLATDTIRIAGLDVKNYTLALATSESDDFSTAPFDGLMGLAQQKLSNSGKPTPIDAMYNEKLVKAPVMGYHLGDATSTAKKTRDVKQDGAVTFGGVDSSKFNGTLIEIDNVSDQGFYEIPIDSIAINGKTVGKIGSGRTSILDTGTSLMIAPQADAEAIHAEIPGAKSDGQGGFTVPCNNSAVLSFKFGGQDWPLLPRDMIFQAVDSSDPDGACVSSLGGGNVGQKNEWLVGAVALKRLYYATNAEKNVIGLGRLKQEQK